MKFKVALCALALVAATVSAADAAPAAAAPAAAAPSILARASSTFSSAAVYAKDCLAAGADYATAAPAQALTFAKTHPYKASCAAVVALVGSYMIYRSCTAKACEEEAEQA